MVELTDRDHIGPTGAVGFKGVAHQASLSRFRSGGRLLPIAEGVTVRIHAGFPAKTIHMPQKNDAL
jgi:hypothetical protein